VIWSWLPNTFQSSPDVFMIKMLCKISCMGLRVPAVLHPYVSLTRQLSEGARHSTTLACKGTNSWPNDYLNRVLMLMPMITCRLHE
jgi:hypothetical protein